MKKIRPKTSKFKTEIYANIIISAAIIVLFVLNLRFIDFNNIVLSRNLIYGILLILFFIYFVALTILKAFYKIKITDAKIAFHHKAFNRPIKYNLSEIKNAQMEKEKLVLTLMTLEVIKIDLRKYSNEQHIEIIEFLNKQ